MLLCSRHTSLFRTAAAGTTNAGSADRRLAVKLSLAQSSGKLDLSEFELDSVPIEVFALAGLEVSITKGGCPLQVEQPQSTFDALAVHALPK